MPDLIQIEGLQPPGDDAGPTLRERSATALERALGFVADYGHELALLRAHVVLEAAAPGDAIERVGARQREDGSCPPLGFVFSGAASAELRRAEPAAELVGVLETLAVLAELRGLTSEAAERAVACATRLQRQDGSWGRVDRSSPQPIAGEDRVFATGMLAGYALRTPFVRPEVVDWAGRFLRDQWSPERLEGGRLLQIGAFAHFFANGGAPDLADAALQWCGRELERGFRSGRFEAVETLRVLASCDAHALPGSSFDTVELLERLLAEQAADGGFAALDPGGPPGRVAPTLDALMAIRSLCQALS